MKFHEVTLPEMLDARERRADIQDEMLKRHAAPLICFTMNIAGPIKNSPLILHAFRTGMQELELSLKRCRIAILEKYEINEATGNEVFYAADAPAHVLKQICCELEDADELGRLYDMDVLAMPGIAEDDSSGCEHAISPVKIERQLLGLPERSCIICGAPGRLCASRRVHTVAELQERTQGILSSALRDRTASRVAEYAIRSLLYEVCVTPKPGLVDRVNCGSHRDMDIYTFMSSSASLFPYFEQCFLIAYDSAAAQETPSETFSRLRNPGKLAENHMLRATDGVNTHKGAIFTIGIVCGALGRLTAHRYIDNFDSAVNDVEANRIDAEQPVPKKIGSKHADLMGFDPRSVAAECAAMTRGLTKKECGACASGSAAPTHGERLYQRYGITGVRGQVEAGLPAVIEHGLPLLEELLTAGYSEDETGAAVLLSMIAHTVDTNLITRSDIDTQHREADRAGHILESFLTSVRQPCTISQDNHTCASHTAQAICSACNAPEQAENTASAQHSPASSAHTAGETLCTVLSDLDRDYISRNLSPGGSADLLAVCWMLHFCRSM